MSLPLLEIPRYELTLLTQDKKIKYRPFVVKEQKVLLTALNTGERKDVLNAIMECVKVCTFNEVNVERLPTFEIERLFLHIRAKSVGEELPLKLKCEGCGEFNDYTLNLVNMEISNLDKIVDKVAITDNYGFVFEYPTVDTIQKISPTLKDIDIAFYYDLAKYCMVGVYSEDQFFKVDKNNLKEVEDVLNVLSDSQLAKVREYFDNIPVISYTTNFECVKCKKQNTIKLQGIDDFFG